MRVSEADFRTTVDEDFALCIIDFSLWSAPRVLYSCYARGISSSTSISFADLPDALLRFMDLVVSGFPRGCFHPFIHLYPLASFCFAQFRSSASWIPSPGVPVSLFRPKFSLFFKSRQVSARTRFIFSHPSTLPPVFTLRYSVSSAAGASLSVMEQLAPTIEHRIQRSDYLV